jgi:hypothetical protein
VSNVSINYWWYATSRKGKSCVDALTVSLLDSNGQLIGQVQKICNSNSGKNWQQASFNASSMLSKYGGQDVTLVFSGNTSASQRTTAFFIDDVGVSAQ